MQFFFNFKKNKDVKRFRAGDRVLCVCSCPGIATLGETGTVMLKQGNCVAVEWDDEKEWRHNCDGRCSDKRGWWVPKYEVIRI